MNFRDDLMKRIKMYKDHYLRNLAQNSACDNHENAWSLTQVSNTMNVEQIYKDLPNIRIDLTADKIKEMEQKNIKYFSNIYKNNVLLLAISKGYNHVEEEEYTNKNKEYPAVNQKDNINYILSKEYVDKEYINTKNGIDLTSLEIAILRHDDLEIINKLIEKGEEVPSQKRVKDLLSLSYRDTQKIVDTLTGGIGKQNAENKEYGDNNKFLTFTLTTKEQFKANKEAILERFGIQENTYFSRLKNVLTSSFEPIKESWNEGGIIGKVGAILFLPFVLTFTLLILPFAPLLAIDEKSGFANEGAKSQPKSNLINLDNARNNSQENLHTEKEQNKSIIQKVQTL